MEVVSDTLFNTTNTTNTTGYNGENGTSENWYVLFGFIIVAIIWIKGFNKLYYWLMIDVFKFMIWYDDAELKRRLDVYTSMAVYGTNIPDIIGYSLTLAWVMMM
jgi:hypothetical protein